MAQTLLSFSHYTVDKDDAEFESCISGDAKQFMLIVCIGFQFTVQLVKDLSVQHLKEVLSRKTGVQSKNVSHLVSPEPFAQTFAVRYFILSPSSFK